LLASWLNWASFNLNGRYNRSIPHGANRRDPY
jgi:hypothetical protein